MKSIAWATMILILLHLLAGVGFGAWLVTSGRVNRERLVHVVETFKPTIAQEEAEEAHAAQLEAEAKVLAANAARLEAVSQGPQTLQDKLATEEQADELAIHRLERLQRETDDLRRQIERAKELLAKQKADLEAERQAFQEFVDATTKQMQDADFQQAVKMYEQLKPKQAKQMFQQMLAQNQTDEVVAYLAAMQLRKAAAVLKEFKSLPEIEQAAGLINKLRERGVYMDGDGGSMAGATE